MLVVLLGGSFGTVVQDVTNVLPSTTSNAEIRNRFIGLLGEERACSVWKKTASA